MYEWKYEKRLIFHSIYYNEIYVSTKLSVKSKNIQFFIVSIWKSLECKKTLISNAFEAWSIEKMYDGKYKKCMEEKTMSWKLKVYEVFYV